MPASKDRVPLPGSPAVLSNAPLVEALYEEWKSDPPSVGEEWRLFFEGFDMAMCPRTCVAAEQARAQSKVASLIFAYRSRGHLLAQTDPLADEPPSAPALALEDFGLSSENLDQVFDTGHLAGGPERETLRGIVQILRETYCGPVGVEYVHIQDREVRRWLQGRMEPVHNRPLLEAEIRLEILERLTDAELFESFMQSRYPGQKRFSIEGSESAIAALHAIVELAPDLGVEEIVAGMAHRGRLNVLVNILDKSYAELFSEFEENVLPDSYGGDGDVKYHKGYASDHVNRAGRSVHISLTSNPSHLEAVDPVVLGRARAKQRRRGDTERRRSVLPLLLHGDAAFAGQGLVAETLNLSQLKGYTVGGTVHLVINNQIGFTTTPKEGRSTNYPTDVAKMVEAPIFHVNGDDPEAVVFVSELALAYRQEFGRDAFIDLVCYRRHGHNESDEPAFTQPLLYKKIKDRPSVRRLYTQRLLAAGVISAEQAEAMARSFQARLQEAFETVKVASSPPSRAPYHGSWEGIQSAYSHEAAKTGVSHGELVQVARALTTVPDGFRLNPKIGRHLPARFKAVDEKGEVDWALAESLAFGSLLVEGTPVRLSGQDSARGTFSQRHAVWQDVETQDGYASLDHIREGQAKFCVYNSMLSEAAVLGFDYGYSLDEPGMLVLWEAQFGDFANGAQVIIDQFLTSSLSKWNRASGLVLLLPHGQEGQGPEHSNAYLERYLAACADDNLQVVNLTTPAQYFHALRRQVRRGFRRPLVVMAPKSMLRDPRAVSPVEDLVSGHFSEILDDPQPPAGTVRRLVFCSGKIFYDLLRAREKEAAEGTAIVRIEQIYPFHEALFREVAGRYPHAAEVVWAQEETRNRGGWSFVSPLLSELLPGRGILYAGREPAASPAVGSLKAFQAEQAALARRALGVQG